MNKLKAFALTFFLAAAGFAAAQVIPSLPYNLTNGTIADANQVMANFNQIVSSTNTNAANAGANTNITALLGMTTPLAPASGGSSVYTGGTSGGTANAQTVLTPTPIGYTLAAGRVVVFIAGSTNTGAMTLNVANTGVANVYQRTTTGITALVGGEVVVGTAVQVYYDGTQYQLFDQSPQANVAVCTTIDYSGHTVPSGYLATDGSAVSRTTYAALFGCLSKVGVAATTTSGSTSVAVANSALYQVGWFVGGANVTCDSTITAIPDGTHITISANAGASGATTLTIGPYSQGDCSTTFAVPNYNGRATVMADASGGTVLTSTTCTNPNSIGTKCGAQTQTLTLAQLPTGLTSTGSASLDVTFSGTIPFLSSSVGFSDDTGSLAAGSSHYPRSTSNTWQLQPTGITGAVTGTMNVTSNNTSGNAHPIVQPIGLVTKAIKF